VFTDAVYADRDELIQDAAAILAEGDPALPWVTAG